MAKCTGCNLIDCPGRAEDSKRLNPVVDFPRDLASHDFGLMEMRVEDSNGVLVLCFSADIDVGEWPDIDVNQFHKDL